MPSFSASAVSASLSSVIVSPASVGELLAMLTVMVSSCKADCQDVYKRQVNIYGGTIRNNHAYSGNGGAIYVEAGGTLNLFGGEITGNTASGNGGGIYVEAGGRVNAKGAPIVKDNTANGKPSNLYICVSSSGPLLTIDAEGLTTDVQIGVSTDASCQMCIRDST